MKVLSEYPDRHHYFDRYEKTNWFCAHCGKQEVWDSMDPGDYYLGTESICVACGWSCHYVGGPTLRTESNVVSILEQLRSGVTKDPTTKRGN